MLYETHSHTTLCKHAVGTPDEYAQAALEAGLVGYTITCHNPMPDGFSRHVRMAPEEFDGYVELVRGTQARWEGQLDVRLGLECDYFPGYEDWLKEQTASEDFDYILGSVHPQLAEFRERFWTGDPIAFQRSYFLQLAMAAETKLFDCISHPDLIKNDSPKDWRPSERLDDIRIALDRIADAGCAMELNTSGTYKRVPEMNPFPEMLCEMQSRGIPIVIGADAHEPGRVGDDFVAALDLLADCGFTSVSYFLKRERQEVAIDAARTSLTSLQQTI